MDNYWKRFSLVAFLSVLLSAYLLYHYTEVTGGFQEEKSFCSINATFDCDTVAQSGYAVFFGVPVAGWAFVYYILLLVLLKVIGGPGLSPDETNRKKSDALLFYSFLSLAPSLCLLAVSHFVLHKYCLMCCALDIANILLFTLALLAPNRSGTFFERLLRGAKTFASAVFDFGHGLGLSPALSIWVTLLLSLCVVLLVPEALARHYFLPRRLSYSNKDYLNPFLESWKREPSKAIPYNVDAAPIDKDFAVGNPNALVKIVEFSDFECPFCKKTAQFLKPFILKNAKDFYFVFKNYPLDKACNSRIKAPKHLYACQAAITARCAGLQSDELFWKLHDALMAASSFDEAALKSFAEEAQVHQGAFETCLNDPLVMSRMREDTELGNSLGVLSTPTIYINGKKTQLAPPYLPAFLQMVLEEVKRGGAK